MMMTEEIDALVARIRDAMHDGKVTAAELARRAGMSEGYVSQLLNDRTTNGRRKPGPVLVMAHQLGLVEIKG